MGIPFYFKSLISRYPHIINSTHQVKCNRLYFDYNCILHQSAHKVISSLGTSLVLSVLEDAIIEDALDTIVQIIRLVNPSQMVFVAIDGLCPRAKLVQQRKRRFMTAWRNKLLVGPKANDSDSSNLNANARWDSNCITPGTQFMAKFNNAMHYFHKHKLQTMFPNLHIVVSDSSVVGEGEHKIFDMIHDFKEQQESINVIYGLDADLIILSLINSQHFPRSKLYLLRERPVFDLRISTTPQGESYLALNISALADALCKTYNVNSEDRTRFIYDYSILCTLIGNDFLPPLSFLKIKNNGIDMIVNEYRRIYEMIKNPLVCLASKSLNIIFIHEIVQALSQSEDANMIEASDQYYKRSLRYDRHNMSREERIAYEIDNYPTIHKYPFKIDPRQSGWRMNYYQHLFGRSSPDLINAVSNKYIQGLEWVVTYYFDYKNADFTWCYEYIYSPTLLDLCNYMHGDTMTRRRDTTTVCRRNASDANHTTTNNKTFFEMMRDSEFQLLMVLPPQSFQLLSPALQKLKSDPRFGCLHYYPEDFKISTYLKHYLWECSPNLPEVDMDYLYQAYTRAIS